MPRVRKTASGAAAQPVEAFSGQEYGKGVAQEKMQRAMPVPSEVSSAQTVNPPTGPVSAPGRPPTDLNQLRESLAGIGGILNQPDDRPDIPFTQMLDDPQSMMNLNVMRSVNKTGEIMRELSRRTGDSTFADLAAKAGF